MLQFAQVGSVSMIAHWVIVALVIAGIVGIGLIVARQVGLTIPQFLVQILWIVLAVVLGVAAIVFLSRQLEGATCG